MRVEACDFRLTTQDLATAPPPYPVTLLVEELLRGNKDAEAKFYEAFSPLVKGFIRKWQVRHFELLGLRAFDDEDAFQTVMIRLIYGDRLAAEGFRACESPLHGWLHYDGARSMSLYRYVQRNVGHYLRDLRRSSNPGKGWSPALHAPESPAARNDLREADEGFTVEERLHLRRCSRRCWREMNPFHREVLEHVGVMGFSQADTARKLGVAEATVSMWLKDGKKKLRHCLENSCPEELLPFRVGRT